MSNDPAFRAPILILGVGNTLLRDDAVGIELVNRLSSQSNTWGDAVEFLEGGTLGIALLDYLAGRNAVLLLDAVQLGAEPGTVHSMEGEAVLTLGSRSSSAHEGNAGELLRIARLLGDMPESLFLIGIEPKIIGTGIDLSEQVQAAVPDALQTARTRIDSIYETLRDRYPDSG